MKKSEFKSIVKECLMEILTEGIGNLNIPQNKPANITSENKILKQNGILNTNKQQISQKNNVDIKTKIVEEERKKQLLLKQKKDLMAKLNNNIQKKVPNQQNQQIQKLNIQKNINPSLTKLREDHKNVMMSIFEDTAKNMGNIEDNESYIPPAGASKEQILVSNSTPEELFGTDTANKWAALAFMEPENKK